MFASVNWISIPNSLVLELMTVLFKNKQELVYLCIIWRCFSRFGCCSISAVEYFFWISAIVYIKPLISVLLWKWALSNSHVQSLYDIVGGNVLFWFKGQLDRSDEVISCRSVCNLALGWNSTTRCECGNGQQAAISTNNPPMASAYAAGQVVWSVAL